MEHDERLKAALADRYQIEREIDSGGMATVYRARDLKHDRTVAIKVLKPDLAEAIGADRFLREIRTTANLSHPHILPLFDSGEADGFLFYVMPFLEGESLVHPFLDPSLPPRPQSSKTSGARRVLGLPILFWTSPGSVILGVISNIASRREGIGVQGPCRAVWLRRPPPWRSARRLPMFDRFTETRLPVGDPTV